MATLTSKGETKSWVKQDIPVVEYYDIAIDDKGNPAYIDSNDRSVHWKQDGKNWITLEGSAEKITFGEGGNLFKLNWPVYTVHRLHDGKWVNHQWGDEEVDDFAIEGN